MQKALCKRRLRGVYPYLRTGIRKPASPRHKPELRFTDKTVLLTTEPGQRSQGDDTSRLDKDALHPPAVHIRLLLAVANQPLVHLEVLRLEARLEKEPRKHLLRIPMHGTRTAHNTDTARGQDTAAGTHTEHNTCTAHGHGAANTRHEHSTRRKVRRKARTHARQSAPAGSIKIESGCRK